MKDMLDRLIQKVKIYNPKVNVDLITKAFKFGKAAHEGQYRNSGEKFFIHPYNVALILADLNMDTSTIVAGLLHDVVEDTEYTNEDMINEFGHEIAYLVDGVTKLKKLEYKTKQENQAENLRKMILAMSKDIRVIIVKLADRLHNMRTLEYMTPEKKQEKALETLEIYAPLAHRLGISKIKWELEDLSLRYLKPDTYYDLVEKVALKRKQREREIEEIISILKEELNKIGISSEMSGRPKSFYSIYKKMKGQDKSFEEIFDLTAIRVLVDDIKDCYAVLGAVHTLWKPLPGRFKDYIAMPKPNMYQSLHTTVIGSEGEIFEVQIRTYDMHKTAEYGIAAHWKYKEGESTNDNFDEKLSWLRELLEWQKDLKDPKEFMEALKIDFFTDEVFVFTPNGDVINLPTESTPIDFAYRIHTDIGNRCIGAKVDGRIVPLNYQLQNGNIVEIITSVTSKPSKDWLDIVKTNRAKTKIRQWHKVRNKDINIEKGLDNIEKDLRNLDYDPDIILTNKRFSKVANSYGYNSIEDLTASVGYGTIKSNQVVTRLLNDYKRVKKLDKDEIIKRKLEKKTQVNKDKTHAKTKSGKNGVIVKGLDNIKIRIAKCCNPVPGDKILGYVTMGRGVSVHRYDCPNVINVDDENRFIDVIWENSDESSLYEAEIQLEALDRAGLLAEIALKINECEVNLISINSRQTKDGINLINLVLKINNKGDLEELMTEMKNIRSILNVYRVIS